MSDNAPYKVRASSWGGLFDCAHRWEATHILGFRMPSGPRAALGTAIHAGTAHYDGKRVQGIEVDSMEAGEVLVDSLRNPKDDVDWKADRSININDAERIGLTLLSRYVNDVAPRFHYTSVEMETKPMIIDCGSGVQIQLTGTMDRTRAIADDYGVRIADLKTGTRATTRDDDGNVVAAVRGGFKPQIGTYELLYEHTTGEMVTGPGEIIGMNTGNKPEIAVGEIVNARQTLVGTEDSPGLLQYAAVMFRTGLFPPNPSSTLCSPKYCARWAKCNHHN